jgi:hypothetical protein
LQVGEAQKRLEPVDVAGVQEFVIRVTPGSTINRGPLDFTAVFGGLFQELGFFRDLVEIELVVQRASGLWKTFLPTITLSGFVVDHKHPVHECHKQLTGVTVDHHSIAVRTTRGAAQLAVVESLCPVGLLFVKLLRLI